MVKKLVRWIINLFNKRSLEAELSPMEIEYIKNDICTTYNAYLDMERSKNVNTRA